MVSWRNEHENNQAQHHDHLRIKIEVEYLSKQQMWQMMTELGYPFVFLQFLTYLESKRRANNNRKRSGHNHKRLMKFAAKKEFWGHISFFILTSFTVYENQTKSIICLLYQLKVNYQTKHSLNWGEIWPFLREKSNETFFCDFQTLWVLPYKANRIEVRKFLLILWILDKIRIKEKMYYNHREP